MQCKLDIRVESCIFELKKETIKKFKYRISFNGSHDYNLMNFTFKKNELKNDWGIRMYQQKFLASDIFKRDSQVTNKKYMLNLKKNDVHPVEHTKDIGLNLRNPSLQTIYRSTEICFRKNILRQNSAFFLISKQ